MWYILTGFAAFLAGYIYGFHVRTLLDKLKTTAQRIKPLRPDTGPKSTILEPPLTPAEKAIREQEELIESLNRE